MAAAKREHVNIERLFGALMTYQGPSALITFREGYTYSMPAAPFRRLGIVPGERIRLLVRRVSGRVVGVRVEAIAPSRPARADKQGPRPKVQVRRGRKLITRR